MLSDSDSEGGDIQLTINEHYAKVFAYRKEREELAKLRDKYGSDPEEPDDEEDSEDDESEDEDGEELTPAVDAAILRTLARIKRKDPDIYDKEKGIFEMEQQRTGQASHSSKPAAKSTKPLTIKQHALASTLHLGSRSPSPERPFQTHDQEQRALRSEMISAFDNALDDSDNGGDDLLVPREKTKDEIERAEEGYQDFLRREVGEDINHLVTVDDDHLDIRETEKDDGEGGKGGEHTQKTERKREKRNATEKRRKESDQEFLMNYILNRGWIDRSSKRLPTYKEVTRGVSEGPSTHQEDDDEVELSQDNEFEEEVDHFESSYNFRFEEPGASTIQTHPRNIDSVARRPDTTRKEARERRKLRKKEELLQKKEEVRRLKALKMKELRQKIEKIGREGGIDIDTKAFAEFDLDGDWDSAKHDEQMEGLYGDDSPPDVEKPQWDDDIDIGDIIGDASAGPSASTSSQKKTKKKRKRKDEASDDGVDVDAMDADVPMEQQDEEEWDGTEEMRKRKVQEYLDELYGADFKDMVGGMPTRFKYASVMPHNYALTSAEILVAKDAELNEYMGVKKFAPYRKDSRWDAKRAGRLKDLKSKLKDRRWDGGETEITGDGGRKSKRRKGKKERQRAKGIEQGSGEDANVHGNGDESQ